MVRRILNYYPDYPTRRSYFGEVETPYWAPLCQETPASRTTNVNVFPSGQERAYFGTKKSFLVSLIRGIDRADNKLIEVVNFANKVFRHIIIERSNSR